MLETNEKKQGAAGVQAAGNSTTTTTTTTGTTGAGEQTTVNPTIAKGADAAPKPYNPTGASAYNEAMKNLKLPEYSAPQFSSEYDQQISDAFDALYNREKFSYDYSTDPLYNQYKEQYVQGGKQAMIDTQGQAAALTGGYGSSYGQAAGQQQYEAYLSRLNDVMPELYSNAYNYYRDEGNRLAQQYSLASDMRSGEYSQFRDAVGDRQYAEALAIQQANDRAALGDWSAYAALYGEEAARIAAILQNPQGAYGQGLATSDEIYDLTGVRVKSSKPGTSTSGGSGWGGGNFYSRRESTDARQGAGTWDDLQKEYPNATPDNRYIFAHGGSYQ